MGLLNVVSIFRFIAKFWYELKIHNIYENVSEAFVTQKCLIRIIGKILSNCFSQTEKHKQFQSDRTWFTKRSHCESNPPSYLVAGQKEACNKPAQERVQLTLQLWVLYW